jgi:hypothetical protein
MNTSIKLFCFVTVFAAVSAAAQKPQPEWKIELAVVDDVGVPATNAQVGVSYMVPTPPGEHPRSEEITGLTDANGLFTATHTDTGSISLTLHIQKTGYYPVRATYDLSGKRAPDKWNLRPTWVLKRIVRPIPMYAKYVDGGPPAFNKPIGYDLKAGDWVAPYGKGQMIDIVFNGKLDEKSKNDFDYTLTVGFPNVGDGIQEFDVPHTRFPGEGSALRSLQQAPSEGYASQVVKTMIRHPGQAPTNDMNDPSRNYYFRVRTAVDGTGKVETALYGKIYGDFMQFRYFLNPTPNDRDVEFDPKQNLFTRKAAGGAAMDMP